MLKSSSTESQVNHVSTGCNQGRRPRVTEDPQRQRKQGDRQARKLSKAEERIMAGSGNQRRADVFKPNCTKKTREKAILRERDPLGISFPVCEIRGLLRLPL